MEQLPRVVGLNKKNPILQVDNLFFQGKKHEKIIKLHKKREKVSMLTIPSLNKAGNVCF